MGEFLGIEQQLLTLQTFSRFSMANQLSVNYWVVSMRISDDIFKSVPFETYKQRYDDNEKYIEDLTLDL